MNLDDSRFALCFDDFLDASFQKLILGLLARDLDFLIRARPIVHPKYFSTEVGRMTCKALFAYYDKFRAVPTPDILVVAVSTLAPLPSTRDAYVAYVRALYDLSDDELDKAFLTDTLIGFAERAESAIAVGVAAQNIREFDIGEVTRELNRIATIRARFSNFGQDLRTTYHEVLEETAAEEIFRLGIPCLDKAMRAGMQAGDLVKLLARGKGGKALTDETPILTPGGWRRLDTLQVGDRVIGADGRPTRITGIYLQGLRPVHRVHFTDRTWVDADADHLWWSVSQVDINNGNPQRYRCRTTAEIAEKTRVGKRQYANYKIPTVLPVRHPENRSKLPIDPYLLGVLIGNGGFTSGGVKLSCSDPHTLARASAGLPKGCVFVPLKNGREFWVKGKGKGWQPTNPVRGALVELGLWGHLSVEKFIPRSYLHACLEDRVALLQGLMDTDGTTDVRGMRMVYNTSSEQLSVDIAELAQSLGGVTRVHTKLPKYTYRGERRTGHLHYELTLNLPNEVPPFSLPRKARRVVPKTRRPPSRRVDRVEHLGVEKPMRCISVAAPDGLYVVKDHIVTHNTTVMINWNVALMYQGHRTAFITLELNEKQIKRRHVACISGAPTNKLPEYAPTVITAMESLDLFTDGTTFIKYFHPNSLSVRELESFLRTLRGSGPPVVPIIDYLDYLRAETDRREEWRQLHEIHIDLKGMAERLQVPVITAGQANAAGYQADELSPFHQGGTIRGGMVVDLQWAINRTTTEADSNVMRLVPIQNRNEREDLVTYWETDFSRCFMQEITKAQYIAQMGTVEEVGGGRRKRAGLLGAPRERAVPDAG